MSVTLFESALARLLDSQQGQVGQFIEGVAETVVVRAQVQFDEYFHQVLPVSQDIDYRMDGSTAIVGYVDTVGKTKAKRLAAAEEGRRLTVPPIRSAVDSVRFF